MGAIIELQGKDQFGPHADPLRALRLGCPRAGAVTQFIRAFSTSDVDLARSLSHRAVSAVADLLRQFGVQQHVPAKLLRYRAEAGWTAFAARPELRYIGIWLVSKKAKSTMGSAPLSVPIMVMMEAEGHRIFGYAPGIDRPLLYPEALIKLATDLHEADPRLAPRGDRSVERFLEDALRLWAGPEALVLAQAQNLRRHWPWLKNGNLLLDQVQWGTATTPVSDCPGLRIVRVRDADGHETPEWYAVGAQTSHTEGLRELSARRGFSAGLWRMAGISGGVEANASATRLYASTGPKSSTQRVPLGRSRMSAGDQEFVAANPSLLEVAVAAMQPGDSPLEWALHTHALRMAASHWGENGDALRLPLPLQLAKLMGEYTLLLVDEDEDVPDDAGGDDLVAAT